MRSQPNDQELEPRSNEGPRTVPWASLRSLLLRHEVLVVLTPLQLRTHALLQIQDVFLLVSQRRVHRLQVSAQSAETLRLQRGRVVCALPSAVLGEMALDPLSSNRVSTHINGNTQVMARETNGLDTMLVLLLE